MPEVIAIHGHEIIDLVGANPNGIRLEKLAEIVSERFGDSVTFHTCSAMGMDLDALMAFLEARDKVRIKSGVVYPGGTPACDH
jgi:probable metal-binding protein